MRPELRTHQRLRRPARPGAVRPGAGDPYLPASYAERQRDFLPRTEVHVLPHSGHWPCADDPAAVARLLLAFLGRAAA